MHATFFKRPTGLNLVCALCFAVLLGSAVPCLGQGRGGGGGGMGTPPKPKDPGGDQPFDDRPTDSGSGWVMKYVPPKEGEDEDVLAYLTFKPEGKSVPIKLRIMREQAVKFDFQDKKEVEPEEYPEILTRGLYCRFTWKIIPPPEGKKVPVRLRQKELTNVSFDSFEISGTLDEIRDDYVVIRGRPTHDRLWPDSDAGTTTPGRGGTTAKAKAVPIRKVRLRVLEGVTRFLDADNKSLDAADFEPNHKVEAMIVYGRRGGIALSIKSPTLRSESGEEDRSADGRGGGRQPPRPPSPG